MQIDKIEVCEPIETLVRFLKESQCEIIDQGLGDYHFHEVRIKMRSNNLLETDYSTIDKISKADKTTYSCTCHWSTVEIVYNIDYKSLIKHISDVEAKLIVCNNEKYSTPINLNNSNWANIANEQSTAFYEENRNLTQPVVHLLIDDFPKYTPSQRSEILSALKSSELFISQLSTDRFEEKSKEWFNERILIFILTDLGPDTRDAMMEINALNLSAIEHNIDLKEIIKSNIELANDENWHGMGSTKSLLQHVLSE